MAGVRTVPLSARLVSMLKAWKLKSKFSGLDDLIFPNGHGRHLGHDNLIKRQFLPLFDELKTVERFNWHGLRHFAVSCWIEAGLAPKTVQTFAGHASLQVTMDRYGHLPERRSQEGDGPDCQRAIQLIWERLANERRSPCAVRAPGTWLQGGTEVQSSCPFGAHLAGRSNAH